MKKVDLPAGARPMKTNQIIAVSHVAFIEQTIVCDHPGVLRYICHCYDTTSIFVTTAAVCLESILSIHLHDWVALSATWQHALQLASSAQQAVYILILTEPTLFYSEFVYVAIYIRNKIFTDDPRKMGDLSHAKLYFRLFAAAVLCFALGKCYCGTCYDVLSHWGFS